MSLASFLNSNEDISFPEINCGVLNASTINASVINGGGGGVNITSSDSSITVTKGTGTFDLTNAAQKWSSFSADAEVNMGTNALQNLSACSFSNFSSPKSLTLYQNYSMGVGLNGLYISDGGAQGSGNVGNLYDSYFNKPPAPVHFRQIVDLKNAAVPKWTNQGSNGYSSTIIQFDTSKYPTCTHFTFNLQMFGIPSTGGSGSSGSFGGLGLYITDSLLLPVDDTKSISSARLNTLNYTNGAGITWFPQDSSWLLEYVSTTPPANSNLFLLIATLQSVIDLGAVNVIGNFTADNVQSTVLPLLTS